MLYFAYELAYSFLKTSCMVNLSITQGESMLPTYISLPTLPLTLSSISCEDRLFIVRYGSFSVLHKGKTWEFI